MKKLKIKHKVILSTFLIALSLFVVIFLIILPTIKYIDSLKENIAITEIEIEESYQKIILLKNSINQLDDIKEKVEPFYFLTLNEGEELTIIKELEDLAVYNNLSQNLDVSFNKNPGNSKDNISNLAHYVFKIRISGNFTDVLNYIDDLEELPYYFLIDQVSFARQKSEQNDWVSASFNAILNSTTNNYLKIE
ncbi:MAG: hypothetical protein PHT84_04755 [Candidatus Pacebacteria bacterium]|nr:hypothetical protein [Candidatus Paceibacterota bacterium]